MQLCYRKLGWRKTERIPLHFGYLPKGATVHLQEEREVLFMSWSYLPNSSPPSYSKLFPHLLKSDKTKLAEYGD